MESQYLCSRRSNLLTSEEKLPSHWALSHRQFELGWFRAVLLFFLPGCELSVPKGPVYLLCVFRGRHVWFSPFLDATERSSHRPVSGHQSPLWPKLWNVLNGRPPGPGSPPVTSSKSAGSSLSLGGPEWVWSLQQDCLGSSAWTPVSALLCWGHPGRRSGLPEPCFPLSCPEGLCPPCSWPGLCRWDRSRGGRQDRGAGPLLSHSAWSKRFPCPGGLRFLLLLCSRKTYLRGQQGSLPLWPAWPTHCAELCS